MARFTPYCTVAITLSAWRLRLVSWSRLCTLVVGGELDQATPPELNWLIAAKVAGVRYVELPRCGHCPPLEQPEAFLAAVAEFWGAQTPRALCSRCL